MGCVFIKNLDLVANSQFIKLDEKGLINPLEDRSKFEYSGLFIYLMVVDMSKIK